MFCQGGDPVSAVAHQLGPLHDRVIAVPASVVGKKDLDKICRHGAVSVWSDQGGSRFGTLAAQLQQKNLTAPTIPAFAYGIDPLRVIRKRFIAQICLENHLPV